MTAATDEPWQRIWELTDRFIESAKFVQDVSAAYVSAAREMLK
jgi:hypothetical protein